MIVFGSMSVIGGYSVLYWQGGSLSFAAEERQMHAFQVSPARRPWAKVSISSTANRVSMIYIFVIVKLETLIFFLFEARKTVFSEVSIPPHDANELMKNN